MEESKVFESGSERWDDVSPKMTRGDGQVCSIGVSYDKKNDAVKEEQKSAPFYAYNKINYKEKVKLAREEPVANSIFEFFVSEMDGTNSISVSMSVMEKLFNLKRNALSKHIKKLVDRKFITILKNGNMNVYAINAYIVWTKGDANLWMAKFKTTMIIGFDEQTDMVKRDYSKQIDIKDGR